jgi:hypothetical protein
MSKSKQDTELLSLLRSMTDHEFIDYLRTNNIQPSIRIAGDFCWHHNFRWTYDSFRDALYGNNNEIKRKERIRANKKIRKANKGKIVH